LGGDPGSTDLLIDVAELEPDQQPLPGVFGHASLRAETHSHSAFPLRPSTTSSSRATRPVRSTTPVTKLVEW
jgi:hypothetical protein